MQELISLDNGLEYGEMTYEDDIQVVNLHIVYEDHRDIDIKISFEDFDKMIYRYLVEKEKDLKDALSATNKLKKENYEYAEIIKKQRSM